MDKTIRSLLELIRVYRNLSELGLAPIPLWGWALTRGGADAEAKRLRSEGEHRRFVYNGFVRHNQSVLYEYSLLAATRFRLLFKRILKQTDRHTIITTPFRENCHPYVI